MCVCLCVFVLGNESVYYQTQFYLIYSLDISLHSVLLRIKNLFTLEFSNR